MTRKPGVLLTTAIVSGVSDEEEDKQQRNQKIKESKARCQDVVYNGNIKKLKDIPEEQVKYLMYLPYNSRVGDTATPNGVFVNRNYKFNQFKKKINEFGFKQSTTDFYKSVHPLNSTIEVYKPIVTFKNPIKPYYFKIDAMTGRFRVEWVDSGFTNAIPFEKMMEDLQTFLNIAETVFGSEGVNF